MTYKLSIGTHIVWSGSNVLPIKLEASLFFKKEFSSCIEILLQQVVVKHTVLLFRNLFVDDSSQLTLSIVLKISCHGKYYPVERDM